MDEPVIELSGGSVSNHMRKLVCVLGILFLMGCASDAAPAQTVPSPTLAVPATPTSIPVASATVAPIPSATLPATQTAAPTATDAPATVTSEPTVQVLPSATLAAASPTTAATIAPPATTAATDAATSAPSPTAAAAPPTAAVTGDIGHGKQLFATYLCDSCHSVNRPAPGGDTAPNLGNISVEALRVIKLPDYTGSATDAPGYIRESILTPNVYIVPGDAYLDSPGISVMTQDFTDSMSKQDIQDLTAYLLSLHAK